MNPRRSPVPVRLPPHGVYVWEKQHDHGFRMDAEAHPFAEIFYVFDGTGMFTVAGTRHECGAGDVVVVPPAAEHVIEDRQSPLTLYGVGVSAGLLACDPDAVRQIRPGVVPGSRVLAGRARYSTADAPLPVYERWLIGGSHSLRGFDTGAFEGDKALVTSAELRVPITSVISGGKFGVNVFMDAAKTTDYGLKLKDAEWQRGAGAGVFLIASVFKLNLDVARSLDGAGTHVHLSTGFVF